MNEQELIKELKSLKNSDQAKILARFFKTGKGEYGEGDKFLGLKVPVIRKYAKKYVSLNFQQVQLLLDNEFHEIRLCGAIILTYKYEKSGDIEKKRIFDFYIKNSKKMNNWDLVDLTAPKISGPYLFDKDRSILNKFVKSKNLWERRIAVMSTFSFIRQNDFEDCLKFCEILLSDRHDLIHKACGWMLREIGKRDERVLTDFLEKHIRNIPRTELRYAIEKLDEKKRKYYLKL